MITIGLDAAQLTTLVRQVTSRPHAQLSDWQVTLIHGGATTNARVYRLAGQASDQGQSIGWSLVLKEWRQRNAQDGPLARNYWKREACAYQSDLLTAVRPGLLPVACLGVFEQGDTTVWLALKDIATPQPRPWRAADFGRAALDLGMFNGSFLNQPLPTHEWLSRDWLRGWVARCEGAVLELPEMLRQPLIAAHISADLAQDIRRLWDDRERLLTVLEQLPQTICHRDTFVRNLFVGSSPQQPTIAIDWATIGVGPIGEDLAALIGGSLVFFELAAADLQEVAPHAVQHYLDGLRSQGWQGDLAQVQLGYTATLALRYGLGSMLDLAIVADQSSHAWAEQVLGHSIGELIVNTANNLAFFLVCAEQARHLVSAP